MFTRAYPLIFRNRKRPARRPPPGTPVPPPVALVLVSAVYDDVEDPPMLTMQFDRAIDVAAFDGSAVLVLDGAGTGYLWNATGANVLVNPTTLRCELSVVEGDSTPGVLLTAGPGNGIAAVDDGGTWGGVSDLELPFP